MTRLPCLLILLLAAGPVAAQVPCPVAADLPRGIKIGFEDGAAETSVGGLPGLVTVTGTNRDGDSYRMELAQGLHLLSYETIVGGVVDPASRQVYEYGVAPQDLPAPVPLGRWSSKVVATDSQGPREEAQTHAYGEVTEITIGACSYRMFEALIAYDTPDFYVENVHVLPDLGISYLAWSEAMDRERQINVPVAIGVNK